MIIDLELRIIIDLEKSSCCPVFKEVSQWKAVCDVKLRIDSCLSHHGPESKLLLGLNFARLIFTEGAFHSLSIDV